LLKPNFASVLLLQARIVSTAKDDNMANPEQLERLMQGVDAWNKWRQENPGQPVDLEGAKRYGQTLSYVNFRKAKAIACGIRSSSAATRA
jgi:hypothetical protein